MKKRLYWLYVSGESGARCERMLTKAEADLITGIFNELDSEYCSCEIIRVPDDNEIRQIAKDYQDFQKENFYISFEAYYNDFTNWHWKLYTTIEYKLRKEMKLI